MTSALVTRPTKPKRAWFVGHNDPGAVCETDPVSFESWADARVYLRIEISDRFDEVETVADEPEHSLMGQYVEASSVLRHVRPDTPFVLFFNGQVWWVADLPA